MKLLDFNKIFQDESSCEVHLHNLREQEGVVCPDCGNTHHYWDKWNKCWICSECRHKTTLTSGTLFHGSKLPLLYWYTAIHLLTSTKKTFSASEIQRQLGHKRYQPIWELVHKIRSVMGARDTKYKLEGEAELDEGYFTSDNGRNPDAALKRGVGSQRKSKVLVMVESEAVVPTKKSQKDRKVGHLKMKMLPNLKAKTVSETVSDMADKEKTEVVMDDAPSHAKVADAVASVDKRVVKPKEGHKVLPWVHTAISNAKSLILDMYHGVKEKFLQFYLDEFCYKFNRRTFGDKTFERLMIAAVTYTPTFRHQTYRE